jgi:hypothetical protein
MHVAADPQLLDTGDVVLAEPVVRCSGDNVQNDLAYQIAHL